MIRGHELSEPRPALAHEHEEADGTCSTQAAGEGGDDSVHTNQADLSPYVPRGVDGRRGAVARPENVTYFRKQ